MWTGIRYTVASFLRLHDPTLTLGSSTVKAADAVRVLDVLLTLDLALVKHVMTVNAKCFFSTASCETFARPRKCSYISPRVRDQSDRLLQRTARERAENHD